jgi:hypothetical protein
MKSQMHTRNFRTGGNFIGFARADKEALVLLSHEQHVQIKSQRSPCVITGDPGHSPPQVLKSPTSQTQCPLSGRNCRRAGNRQLQTGAKLVTFMTGIRNVMNANAILWQKLRARFSGHAFNQDNRAPVSRVTTHLDVRIAFRCRPVALTRFRTRAAARPELCACRRQEHQ